MSWPNLNQVSCETLNLIQRVYTENGFCFETRLSLDEFITKNFIHEELETTLACQLATQLVEKLSNCIQNISRKDPNQCTIRKTLQRTLSTLEEKISNEDGKVWLYITLYDCLMQEKQIFTKYENGPFLEVQQKMICLKENVGTIVKGMHEIQQEQKKENVNNDIHSNVSLNSNNNHQKMNKLKLNHRTKPYGSNLYMELKKKRIKVLEKGLSNIDLEQKREKYIIALHEILEEYSQVQNDVINNHLAWWKVNQRKNGYGNENSLICIQNLCEDLAESILLLKEVFQQINWDISLFLKEEIHRKILGHFEKLVTSTFMVARQPPQVIRTGGKFTAEIISLVGNKLLSKSYTPFITASILPLEEVNKILNCNTREKNILAKKCGDLTNNVQKFENGTTFQAKFHNIQLKSFKRNKSKECVSEDLCSLMFTTNLKCHGMEFQLSTSSLAVAVVSHDSQRMKANATILWNNAGNQFFETQAELPWIQVFEALSNKWEQTCGKALTKEHNYYLACKAFHTSNIDPNEVNNELISLAQFKNKNLPNKNFTFWQWFDSMMDLTKENLKLIWKKDYMVGFMSRSDADLMLKHSQDGTFMLRFSDSVLGGVTIGYQSAHHSVRWLAPFTKDQLSMRGLADMILDIPQLKSLHPNVPKICFEEFKCEEEKRMDGYVAVQMKFQIVSDEEDTKIKAEETCLSHNRLHEEARSRETKMSKPMEPKPKVEALELYPNTQFEYQTPSSLLDEQDNNLLKTEDSRSEVKSLKLYPNTKLYPNIVFEFCGTNLMDMQTEDSNKPANIASSVDLIQVM